MRLRHRLAVAFVLFATAALGIGGWLVYRSTRGVLERGLDEKLEAVAVAASLGIDGDLVSQLRPGDESTRLFQAYATRLRELAPVSARAFIFDSAGGLLVASWPGAAIGDRVHSLDLYGAEIAEVRATGTASTTLFRDEGGRWFKLGFARLDEGPAILAVAMPASFLEPLERLRAQMISFALVALAAIALAAALLSRGLTRALEQLSLKLGGDLFHVAAERRLSLLAVVVGVAVGQVAHGRLALHVDVLLEVVHVERGLGRILDPPDHHGGDLDRVAPLVVDLQLLAVEVPRPQRDPPFHHERIGPMPTALSYRSAISTEEDQDPALVRLQGEVPETT